MLDVWRRDGMDFNGYLMSGDTAVAQIQKGRIISLDENRMPLYLAANDDLETWLVNRAIDRHRTNSRILKKVLRLTDSSDLAAVLRVHGATITDNYWVKQDGENLTYGQVRFSEDSFAEVALTGSFSSYSRQYEKAQIAAGTPELTNIGSYEKCWKLKDGFWWLYKNGNPLERFSELFIAALGKELGFAMAEYFPDGQFVKTRDFTKGVYNFEPAEALVGDEEDYAYNYDRLTALEPSLGKEYLDILFLDALCFNMDRHTKNYGILRDRSTGEVLGMAPNFDNNIALISRGYDSKAIGSSGLLMDYFFELLEERNLSYSMPILNRDRLNELILETLPDEDIDRVYVLAMVEDRWSRMERRMEQRLQDAPTQNTSGSMRLL